MRVRLFDLKALNSQSMKKKKINNIVIDSFSVSCPGGSVVKNIPGNAGDTGLVSAQKDPLGLLR